MASDEMPVAPIAKALLQPNSVAILGCSSDFRRINGRPLKYFLQKGYGGRLYPINPKHTEIAGLRCYPDVASVPGTIDLAVVALPASLVLDGVRQLICKGVPAAVIFSSGFAESGEAGATAQSELVQIARSGRLRFCGPNAVGIVNAFEGVTASFSEYLEGPVTAGPIALISQSGAFGTGMAVLARQRGLGLGYFINTGNEADIDVGDALSFVVEDPRIRVIAAYIEGIRDGRKLIRVAERAMALGKPIVVTKVGRTTAGARAAISHTGALAGADAVLDGVFHQKGILRADDEEQLLDLIEMFACCRLPKGPNIGVVSQSGGAGVLACDRAETLGLGIPTLAAKTQAALKELLPGYSAVANPVDLTALSMTDPEVMRKSMKLVLADPSVDIGLLWLRLMDAYADQIVEIIADIKASTDKTLVVSWLAAPERAASALRRQGICVTRGAAQAVTALSGLVTYFRTRERWRNDEAILSQTREIRSDPKIVSTQSVSPTGIVPTLEAAGALIRAGVPLVRTELARDVDEAVDVAARLGYPVAIKIESPQIQHKTEVGGVRLGITNERHLREAFAEIVAAASTSDPTAQIRGILVQPMVDRGIELVIGAHLDNAFGPIVMIGLGGIFVEVLNDVAFAAAPMTISEAESTVARLRGVHILDGVRGAKAVNRARLYELLANISNLASGLGDQLAELDLNPVIATADSVFAVDWIMALTGAPETAVTVASRKPPALPSDAQRQH